MKNEIQQSNDQVEEIKQELQNLKLENYKLKSQNEELLKKVGCYKNLLQAQDPIKKINSLKKEGQTQNMIKIQRAQSTQKERENLFSNKNIERSNTYQLQLQEQNDNSQMQELFLPVSRDSSIKFKRPLQSLRKQDTLPISESLSKLQPESPLSKESSHLLHKSSNNLNSPKQNYLITGSVNENVFLKQFLKIDKYSNKMNVAKSWDEFFWMLEEALQDMFNQPQLRIMMVDKEMQNLYKDERNRRKTDGKIQESLTTSYYLEDVRYLLIQSIKNQQKFSAQKIKVPPVVDINKGLFSKHMIAFPIISCIQNFFLKSYETKKQPLIYIQIENKLVGFTKNDEVAANHFQLYLTALLEKIFYFKYSLHLRQQAIGMLDLFSSLVQKKTHLKIQNQLREKLPSLFEFKQVNILYRDPQKLQEGSLCYLKEDPYIITGNTDSDQHYDYQELLIRIPCDVGITGRAIKENRVMFCEKGSYDGRFRFESDNPMDITHVRNFIIAPLSLEKENNKVELMGVLQLFNKTNDDIIHEIDLEVLSAVCKAIATVLETADELHNSWMIIYQLKEQLHSLMKEVKNGVLTVESQSEIYKEANQSLFDASVAVKQLINSKKHQFINELVTIKTSEHINNLQGGYGINYNGLKSQISRGIKDISRKGTYINNKFQGYKQDQ